MQIIDNIGNWLNYVATLSLVEQLAGGKGLLISALIIVRFLPSFLLFPLAGVVADRSVPAVLFYMPSLWMVEVLQILEICAHSHAYTPCLTSRVDRPKVMLVSTLVNILIVLGLTLIKHPSDIW